MRRAKLCGLISASVFAFASAFAGGNARTYQIVGPILEVNDSMIAVQKGKDRWEIARGPNTKVTGDLKVGARVTIKYVMTATQVEVKVEKGVKKK